jgi:hypothetical protein
MLQRHPGIDAPTSLLSPKIGKIVGGNCHHFPAFPDSLQIVPENIERSLAVVRTKVLALSWKQLSVVLRTDTPSRAVRLSTNAGVALVFCCPACEFLSTLGTKKLQDGFHANKSRGAALKRSGAGHQSKMPSKYSYSPNRLRCIALFYVGADGGATEVTPSTTFRDLRGPKEPTFPVSRYQPLRYEPSLTVSGRLGCGSLRYLSEPIEGLKHNLSTRSR